MISRTLKVSLYSVLALALAGQGLAHAQDTTTTEEGGTTEGGTEATTMEGDASGETGDMSMSSYPMEEVNRPIQLLAGMIEAGAEITLPSGPDEGEFGIGNFIGLRLRADYGITDQLQAGIRIPLAIVKPEGAESLGGFIAEGMFNVMPMLSVRANVGFANTGGMGASPFVYPAYVDFDGMHLGFAAGVAFKKAFGNIALTIDPTLVLHLDAIPGDNGEPDMLQVLQIPVAVHFQVQPAIAIGLRTGLYSGHEFKFSAEDGATLPLVVEGQYTLMNGMLDVGAQAGLATLLTDDMGGFYPGVGDSLFIGVFAAWRNK